MTTPEEVVASSAAVRGRLLELLRSLDAEQAAMTVPACPEWSVTDVARHLYGVADDALAGRLDGVASEAWTGAQVARHGELSIDELCDAWEACGPAFDVGLAVVPPPLNLQAVMDLSTHEHDLRHALGRPGAQDDASVAIGREFVQMVFARRQPELFASFDALGFDDFEVMRVITGRRSAAQLRAAGVEIERVTAIFEISPFSFAAVDIVERA